MKPKSLDVAADVAVQFSLEDYLWLGHLYNVLGNLRPHQRMVIRKAGQIGGTETVIGFALWFLDRFGNVFYSLPPGPVATDFAHARIDPAIRASPYIVGMCADISNVGLKTFMARGGKGPQNTLYIRGSNVPRGDPRTASQLSEAPADALIVDEFDRIPPAAISLVRERLGDSRWGVEIDLSTPTYPDYGIDHEFLNSTQCEPQIRCRRCRTWHWLDWKLVHGPSEDAEARLVCPACGSVISRKGMWKTGNARWVERNPGKEVIGIWIPRLVSDRVSIQKMWKESREPRDLDKQTFHNSTLGLPYEPQGARLTRQMIMECVDEDYADFPTSASWSAMGVDVGEDLTYCIKTRRPDGRENLVGAGNVKAWEDLDVLFRQYGVEVCVVDDAPELREDVKFQKRHLGKVWRANYVNDHRAELARWSKDGSGRVTVERTKTLEEATAKFQLHIVVFPRDEWHRLDEDRLIDQLTVNVKAQRTLQDGETIYYFPPSSAADHLHHAFGYCDVALTRLPPDPGVGGRDSEDESPSSGGERYVRPHSVRGLA